MTPEQFCFWLHGFFELSCTDTMTAAQAKMVREHLDLVFTKVTPILNSEGEPSAQQRTQKEIDDAKKKIARRKDIISELLKTGRGSPKGQKRLDLQEEFKGLNDEQLAELCRPFRKVWPTGRIC